MRTVLELLEEQLAPMGAQLVQNNRDIAFVNRTERLSEDGVERDDRCLYLLDGSDSESLAAIGKPGNYLIAHHFDGQLTSAIGPESNVLKISPTADLEKAIERAAACCEGASMVDARSFSIMDALSGRVPVTEICKIASRILGNPVMVLDMNFMPVASGNATGKTDSFWEQLLRGEKKGDPDRVPEAWRDISDGDLSTINSKTCVRIEDEERSWLRSGIYPGNVPQYMLITAEIARPFAPRDATIVSMFADLLADKLPSGKDARIDPSNLIVGIVEGQLTDPSYIVRGLEGCGIEIGPNTYMCNLYSEQRTPTYLQAATYAELLRRKLGGISVVHGLDVIGIITNKSEGQGIVNRLTEFLDGLDEGWQASLSFPFDSPSDLRLAWEQCKSARRIGGKYYPKIRLQCYSYYMTHDLLEDASEYLDLIRYCMPSARQIIQYDRENETEYARTLYFYLKYFLQTDMVAKALHVHRNTILYRLERIHKLFGVDFDDLGILNSLSISFDILAPDNADCLVFPRLGSSRKRPGPSPKKKGPATSRG
jgi:hypothetical protein